MRNSSSSLRRQIVQLCVSLISLTVIFVIANVWWSTAKFNQNKITSSIANAQNVFQQFQNAQERLLINAAKVLTADFGFKQAVASSDSATIASALDNHGSRIDSDIMIITTLEGVLISSSNSLQFDQTILKSQVDRLVEFPGEAHYIVLKDSLYQAILLPVKAPRPIAYNIVGFKIDDKVAKQLKQLTSLDISFTTDSTRIIASSLIKEKQADIFRTVGAATSGIGFSRPKMTSTLLTIDNSASNSTSVLFTIDLQPSYQELDSLIASILTVALLTFLMSWLLSGLYARKLAQPLARLAKMAGKFAQGDYKITIRTDAANQEIKALQESFLHMGTEIDRRENEIIFQARHDHLTKLLNRHTFMESLNKLVESHQSLLICAFSIRGFRAINDNFGPSIADQCLKAIAVKMKNSCDSDNSLHARIGGDEFVSVLPLDGDDRNLEVANKFISEINSEIVIDELSLNLSYNFGICFAPEHGVDGKSLLRKSIIALEHGTEEKKRLRVYEIGEDEQHLERLKLIEMLEKDLAKDQGNLYMCYQPKLNLKTNKIEKLEALIRWETDEGKFVSPELFIDLAENSGLIVELTRWVLKTVFSQMKTWKEQDMLDIKVAINVSSQDICHPDLLPFLRSTLKRYEIDPFKITLELTERDLMENEELAIDSLNKLKQLGIEISVDDYGIGQSSLAKLKQLPVDELKVDKTFVLNLNQSESDQLIVSSTIELAHNLGLSVVAEGVENKESMSMLNSMGCDHAQGYYLSRPLKPQQLIDWYKNDDKNLL
jgi:diguanylate cyclase (GGDEF)-like protein